MSVSSQSDSTGEVFSSIRDGVAPEIGWEALIEVVIEGGDILNAPILMV
jgi:hypothetical protein